MNKKKNTYWLDFKVAVLSASKGLILTFIHFRDALKRKKRRGVGVQDESYFDYDKGIVTLQYPRETLPIPDNGRYRLHNEIDDCIVCDKCAKVCPVDCIDIEPIKSSGEIRKTSDGSSVRMYAAKFDIDMAKCCYCGLCTTVCPTECLTMTKAYDYSEFELSNMNYEFSDMTETDIQKRQQEYDVFVLAKEKQKQEAKKTAEAVGETKAVVKPKIGVAKPKIGGAKPKIPGVTTKLKTEESTDKPKPLGVAKPKISGVKKPVIPKPKIKKDENTEKKNIIPKPKMESKEMKDTKVSGIPKPKILKPIIPKPKKED